MIMGWHFHKSWRIPIFHKSKHSDNRLLFANMFWERFNEARGIGDPKCGFIDIEISITRLAEFPYKFHFGVFLARFTLHVKFEILKFVCARGDWCFTLHVKFEILKFVRFTLHLKFEILKFAGARGDWCFFSNAISPNDALQPDLFAK